MKQTMKARLPVVDGPNAEAVREALLAKGAGLPVTVGGRQVGEVLAVERRGDEIIAEMSFELPELNFLSDALPSITDVGPRQDGPAWGGGAR